MTTRDTVLVAAQRLLGTDPTASMAQIAAAAEVGRATVHRHFASRDDLLREIGRRSLGRWEESLAAASVSTAVSSGDPTLLRSTVQDLLRRFVVDAEEFGIALTDPTVVNDPELRARSEELFAEESRLYAAAQKAGLLRSDVSARWLGQAVYGLLVAVRDALQAGDIARRDAGDLLCSTFFAGSGAR